MSSCEVEWEGTGDCFGSQGRYSFTWYSIKSSPTASCDFLLGRTGYHCLLDCLVSSAMFRWTAPRAWSWSRTLNFRTPLWTLWGTLLHRKGIKGEREGERKNERLMQCTKISQLSAYTCTYHSSTLALKITSTCT